MGGTPKEISRVEATRLAVKTPQPTGKNRNSSPSGFAVTVNSSSEPTTQSASCSSAAECVPNTPSTRHPAPFPDPTPEGASSTTTHSSGRKPSNSAPRRYGSGSGLPRSTTSPLMIRSGNGSPAAFSRASSRRCVDEVTIAHRSGGKPSSSAFTPGSTVKSATSSTSRSVNHLNRLLQIDIRPQCLDNVLRTHTMRNLKVLRIRQLVQLRPASATLASPNRWS